MEGVYTANVQGGMAGGGGGGGEGGWGLEEIIIGALFLLARR